MMLKAQTSMVAMALRMLKRDWRSGHMTVLLIALLVAVTTHTTIGFLTTRIHDGMEAQAATLMGGDLVVRSPRPTPDNWRETADAMSIRHAQTLEFSSVVFAGDNTLLTAIKTVTSSYPLLAPLKIADDAFAADYSVDHGPAPGQVWVEKRVLSDLGIKVGDSIDIGDATFMVEKVLTFEPDRSGNFYSLVPRVLMHWNDVAATQVIQPGSRLDYFAQFAGDAEVIRTLREVISSKLEADHRIQTVDVQQRTVSSALRRAEGYLRLASLMAILLAAVAIGMGAHYFSRQHFDTAALLRCFGLSALQILQLFVIQLVVLAVLAGLLGGSLGWLFHFITIAMLADLLPANMPLPSLKPMVTGIFLAVVLLLGFALPALAQLQRTPPLRVLRRDLTPLPLSRQLSYALTLGLVALLMAWYVRDINLIIAVVGGVIGAGLLTFVLGALFMRLLAVLGKGAPVSVQAGLRNVIRRSASTRIQLLGFGLTGMAMLMVILVRTELITTWHSQLPQEAPNHFAMNILPNDANRFGDFLQQQQIVSQPVYPMIRGRLTHINREPALQAVTKESPEQDAPEALTRELNLTYAADLPSDNRIVAGQWWTDLPTHDERQVSIEERLADRLNIKLGDELFFFVANQTFTARVTSIRTVRWESFQPNFYMVFRPGDLDGLPTTFLTSFHLTADQKPLLKNLSQAYPSVSILEVDAILARVKVILAQVSAAVEFILLFVLAAGLTITIATLITTMPERYREGALMRTLGSTSRQLRIQQWTEFFAIGLLAGLVASAGAELARFGLYWKIFDLPYTPALWIWIIVPPLMGLLIGIAGHWSSRKILGQSPLIVLRDS